MMSSNVLAAMADLEDRRADAGQRHQIALHFGQHRLGQHGRAGGKIVDSLRHRELPIVREMCKFGTLYRVGGG